MIDTNGVLFSMWERDSDESVAPAVGGSRRIGADAPNQPPSRSSGMPASAGIEASSAVSPPQGAGPSNPQPPPDREECIQLLTELAFMLQAGPLARERVDNVGKTPSGSGLSSNSTVTSSTPQPTAWSHGCSSPDFGSGGSRAPGRSGADPDLDDPTAPVRALCDLLDSGVDPNRLLAAVLAAQDSAGMEPY
jgi:hypothetical protein